MRRNPVAGRTESGPRSGPGSDSRSDPAAHAVVYLRECDPLSGQVPRSSKATPFRHERDRPGALAHMDVKNIGHDPTRGG